MESKELLQTIKDYIDEKIHQDTGLRIASKVKITVLPTSAVSSDLTFVYDGVYHEKTSNYNHFLEQKLQDLTGAIVHLQQIIQDQDARLRFLEQQVIGVPPYSAPPFYYTTGSGTSTI